ncbi:FUSC family protein [Modestobacter lapidis]|nr:hypothetical protein [Modestobacter lapidis]
MPALLHPSGEGAAHPGRPGGWTGPLRRTWARHPRLGLAVKAALAAVTAWVLVGFVPGPASDYPYYAPLGAVIATSTTVAGSARESLQTVAAIALGAAVAIGFHAVPGPRLLALAAVVAIGVLLAGWHRLGSAGSWLPTSALFVLIIGRDNPTGYVLGYTGLTFLGALVGVAVTAAFPPLPLAPAEQQLKALRDTLAGQLDDLVDGLSQEHPPTQAGWQGRIHTIDPVLAQMRTAVQQTMEARRGNRRARRYRNDAERQYQQARALERLTLLVEDLTQLIAETENADNHWVPLGPSLRLPAARALAGVAEVLRSVEGATADPKVSSRAHDVLRGFADELRRVRVTTGDDLFVAGNILENLRRSLAAMPPHEEPADEPPG